MRLSLYLFFKTSLKCEIINDSHLESCSSLKFPTKRFFAGDHRGEVIPVPIPNTEVKLSIAEGSAGLARARVGRRRLIFAPIAQLDRVSDYESEGCRFDSCWARHLILKDGIPDCGVEQPGSSSGS